MEIKDTDSGAFEHMICPDLVEGFPPRISAEINKTDLTYDYRKRLRDVDSR